MILEYWECTRTYMLLYVDTFQSLLRLGALENQRLVKYYQYLSILLRVTSSAQNV